MDNKTPEQLSIDLAFRQGRLQTLINEQAREWLYAYGGYDAPSAEVQERFIGRYWVSENAIQENLTAILQIKESLAS